jgi:hypothetical protein
VFSGLLAATGPVVLLDDVPGQATMFGHGEAVLLRPCVYLAAAFAAGSRPGGGPRPSCTSQPGSLDEGAQQVTEAGGMFGIQVDFVGPAINAEVDGLVGRAAGQVILKPNVDLSALLPPGSRLTFQKLEVPVELDV